jgi:hypothetical protein
MTIFLGLLFLAILLCPSGPACPECKTHFTKEFDLKGLHKKTKTEHRIQAKVCYKCNHKWDMYKDGQKVTTFADAIKDEEDTDE